MSEEHEKIFELDKYNLDKEWVNQPKLYGEYAADLAEARKAVEEAKADLELVEAKLDIRIRKNPGKYGLDKITESAIKTVIITSPRRQKANDDLIKAKHYADLLSAMVSTLEHRKRALEKLVDLQLADYFSEPRLPKGRQKEMDDAVEAKVARKGQYKAKRKKN